MDSSDPESDRVEFNKASIHAKFMTSLIICYTTIYSFLSLFSIVFQINRSRIVANLFLYYLPNNTLFINEYFHNISTTGLV